MRRSTQILALLLTLLPALAFADTLPRPTGPVILTVSGKIANTNAEGRAEFDRAMLERLGTASIKTSTDWTQGAPTFGGTPLAKLLAAVGAGGATLRAVALNDYKATLPASDARLGVLLATTMDGTPMPVRDKGPIWIVYPLDQSPALRSDTIKGRMVWQLKALVVE